MNRVLRSLCGPLWAGVAVALVAAGAAAASADEPVARVVAVRGSATAQSPGEEPRPLRCNDPLRAGDRVATEPGASVSLLAGDVYAGLDARTVATVDGAPDRPTLAVVVALAAQAVLVGSFVGMAYLCWPGELMPFRRPANRYETGVGRRLLILLRDPFGLILALFMTAIAVVAVRAWLLDVVAAVRL